MKDNFSTQAKEYSKYRPHYSQEVIDYIVSFVKEHNEALDVATGNGQVAGKLSDYFDKVYAIDISTKQLDNAIQKDNIIYSEQPAEHTNFSDKQFDLITVAQAIHWFDFDAFYKEVYRILKPDGVFAVLGYGQFSMNPDSNRIVTDFYENTIGPYWDPERIYVDENYTTIPFPFEELEAKQFSIEFTWEFEHLIGYLDTWSAVQHYIKKNGTNPIDSIREELKASWEKGDKKVYFPLLLRIGKLK